MIARSGWRLNHLVVVVLMGAFALLLIEVRYLHHEVLREHAIAWTPIVYSGLMTLAIVVGVVLWDRGGRRALFWAFAPALVIGPVGFWRHNGGRPLRGLEQELAAWKRPIHPADAEGGGRAASASTKSGGAGQEGSGSHDEHEEADEGAGGPPALAPLAIAGLGLLGMLACARRFQPEPAGSRAESAPAPGRAARGPTP